MGRGIFPCGPCADDQSIGDVTIEHVSFFAAQEPLASTPLGARRDVTDVVATMQLLIGERQQTLTADDGGKHLFSLRRTTAEPNRAACEQNGGHPRLRQQPLAKFIEHHGEVRISQTQSAQVGRENDPQPPELRHVLPEVAREAVRVVSVTPRTDASQR